MTFRDVLIFWFEETAPEKWFAKDDAFDAAIKSRFSGLLVDLAREIEIDGCSAWEDDPRGAVATVIVLDQFPRNIHRDTPAAFQYDALAWGATRRALEGGMDETLTNDERHFLYMPLMHQEDLAAQELCVELFQTRLEAVELARFAIEHRDIIKAFGRFPHRNAILGRESTAEELAFLEAGGFAG